MRKNFFILITCVFTLLAYEKAYAISVINHPPAETLLLKLPNPDYAHWKEMTRRVTEKEGLVVRIPFDQTDQNWSEALFIQFFDGSDWDREIVSLGLILDKQHEKIISSYPESKSTWNIIEKNENDAVYEWMLHEPHNDRALLHHDVARCILTETGFHQIYICKKGKELDLVEKGEWVELLKHSVSVHPFKEAEKIPEGLSLVNRFKDSLDMGSAFSDWVVIDTATFDNGLSVVFLVEPSLLEENELLEWLEVVTSCHVDCDSIEQAFEVGKKTITARTPGVEFQIRKKTPNEIIYTYSYPSNNEQVTSVVRSCISDLGYYSVTYKQKYYHKLKEKVILEIVEALEEIQIRPSL